MQLVEGGVVELPRYGGEGDEGGVREVGEDEGEELGGLV